MFYLDEYISFLTIVCGSFCGSLEYIVCLGTACENMATVLKEIKDFSAVWAGRPAKAEDKVTPAGSS